MAGTEDADVVHALCSFAEDLNERELLPLCRSLIAIGGPKAQEEARDLADLLDSVGRASVLEQLDARPLKQIADAAIKAGLADPAVVQKAVNKLRKWDRSGSPPGLYLLLEVAGVLVAFDAETGMLPCRHDGLVRDFARASRGKFAPTAVSEQWHQAHEDDFEAEYTLRFIESGRLYEGRLRNFGDWYDVERTVEMINQALVDAGHLEQFVLLESDGQVASYVFADPERLQPLADEFHLPLGGDPLAPMERGKDFERRVREEL